MVMSKRWRWCLTAPLQAGRLVRDWGLNPEVSRWLVVLAPNNASLHQELLQLKLLWSAWKISMHYAYLQCAVQHLRWQWRSLTLHLEPGIMLSQKDNLAPPRLSPSCTATWCSPAGSSCLALRHEAMPGAWWSARNARHAARSGGPKDSLTGSGWSPNIRSEWWRGSVSDPKVRIQPPASRLAQRYREPSRKSRQSEPRQVWPRHVHVHQHQDIWSSHQRIPTMR